MQKASVRQVEKARIIPLVSPQEDRPNPQRDPRGLRQRDFVDGHVAALVPWIRLADWTRRALTLVINLQVPLIVRK